MNLPFYIAKRYLFAKKSHNVINVISAISAIGLAIGTAALVLIMSIYNGFDGIIRDNLSAASADVKIVPAQGKSFIPEGPGFDWLREQQNCEIFEVVEENVFLSYDSRQAVAKIKGVEQSYLNGSDLKKRVTEGNLSLMFGELPQCIIGAGLSYALCAHPRFSEKITVYFPKRGENISMADPMSSLRSVELFPGGVVNVDAETDKSLMIAPLSVVRELVGYEKEVSALEVKGSLSTGKIASHLGPDFQVLDRYSQNSDLFRVMRYEKLAIFLILIFVIILIAFNVFGSLSMLIIEKEDDMETLKAMGADDSLVRRIFVLEGWLISLSGLVSGLVIGLVLTLVQQYAGIVKMPGNFLVEAYPVVLKPLDVLLSVLGVALVGYLVAIAATASRLNRKRK